MVSVSMPIRHIPAGLDARAASIVMKAIKNVALSNRTVFVTIHQPSIQIFEAFDFLMLLQVRTAGLLAGAGEWGRGSAGIAAITCMCCRPLTQSSPPCSGCSVVGA